MTPEIDFFDIGAGSGTSTRISLGANVGLEWNIFGIVTDLTITPRDSDGLAGAEIDVISETSLTVEPTETTIYTLTAENNGTSVSARLYRRSRPPHQFLRGLPFGCCFGR